MSKETRIYPTCCTSALCGRVECEGCPSKPTLDNFKAWREANQAIREDPIWCPGVWTAQKGGQPT
jgi:hypothetical protein